MVSGGYAITAAGAVDGNYTISYASGTLTVTPAPLTISAANATKVYGAALPALTATYSGFVNGDTAASLTTAPSLSTTATAASPVSPAATRSRPPAPSMATTPSRYAAGTLTITPAMPAISVSAPGGGFDGSPFPASVRIAGSGNANTPAASLEDVTPALTYYAGSGTSGTSIGSSPPTAPGTYTVVARFPGSTDYAATQSAPTTFTIDQATSTLALTPSGGSAVYGQAVTFVATVTASGGNPTGNVTFSAGGTVLGTVPLDQSGRASLTTSSLARAPSRSPPATPGTPASRAPRRRRRRCRWLRMPPRSC